MVFFDSCFTVKALNGVNYGCKQLSATTDSPTTEAYELEWKVLEII